nr:sugar transferase [Loktanella atrilutea]
MKANPRITTFVRFLLRLSLNKLLQLWKNMLPGDMSPIGPRLMMLSQTNFVAGASSFLASVVSRHRLGSERVHRDRLAHPDCHVHYYVSWNEILSSRHSPEYLMHFQPSSCKMAVS